MTRYLLCLLTVTPWSTQFQDGKSLQSAQLTAVSRVHLQTVAGNISEEGPGNAEKVEQMFGVRVSKTIWWQFFHVDTVNRTQETHRL